MPIVWIPWIETTLLGLILLISALQPHTLNVSLQTLSSPIQRRYNIGGNRPLVNILRALFELGTISLALMMAVAAYWGCNDTLMMQHYGLTIMAVVIVVLFKALIDKWLQLTFCYAIHEQTYYRYRNELWLTISMVLWLVMLISSWLSTTMMWVIPITVAALYYSLLWWKIMQVFGWTFQHMAFAILYMLHVEILPIVAAIAGIGIYIK